jgi:hypothetical protein
MAGILQHRRVTTAQLAAITPAFGELVLNTDDGSFVMGDGVTVGGAYFFYSQVNAAWTPALRFGGATTGITYGVQAGSYSRNGKLVVAEWAITLTSKGSATGAATIAGLPVNAGGTNLAGGIDITSYSNMSSITSILGNVPVGASVITLSNSGAAGSAALADTNFTNTTVLNGSVAYITA